MEATDRLKYPRSFISRWSNSRRRSFSPLRTIGQINGGGSGEIPPVASAATLGTAERSRADSFGFDRLFFYKTNSFEQSASTSIQEMTLIFSSSHPIPKNWD